MIIVWQWFDNDPEAANLRPPALPQGANWYNLFDGGPWMDLYLSMDTEWREAFSTGYQSVMRYWPGDVPDAEGRN